MLRFSRFRHALVTPPKCHHIEPSCNSARLSAIDTAPMTLHTPFRRRTRRAAASAPPTTGASAHGAATRPHICSLAAKKPRRPGGRWVISPPSWSTGDAQYAGARCFRWLRRAATPQGAASRPMKRRRRYCRRANDIDAAQGARFLGDFMRERHITAGAIFSQAHSFPPSSP